MDKRLRAPTCLRDWGLFFPDGSSSTLVFIQINLVHHLRSSSAVPSCSPAMSSSPLALVGRLLRRLRSVFSLSTPALVHLRLSCLPGLPAPVARRPPRASPPVGCSPLEGSFRSALHGDRTRDLQEPYQNPEPTNHQPRRHSLPAERKTSLMKDEV